MDSKNNNHTPSDAEQFFSKLPCPVFITVFSSFVFVYLLGLIFGQGVQVYPIYNEIMPDDDCPECRVFNGTKASITERQFRIIFRVISPLDITRSNAWRLLRIRIYGPIFSQEMRAVTDNCGLYAYGVHQSAMHFELIQEGPTTVELYCLDKLMLTVSSDVTRYERSTQSTLFHTNLKEVSNICRVEELNDEYFVFFSKSNVFNYTNNKEFTYIPRLKHQRKSYDDYISDNSATVFNNVFRLDYTNEDINRMSYHELFEKVLLVIFVQSHFGQTIIFSYNKNINQDSSIYFDLFRKVTDGKFRENDYHNYKNVFCYQKMTTVPNYHKIEFLTESEYEILRKCATPKDASRGDKIYLASNFMLSDELDKDINIYYFGEEKAPPPTQSPSPPPTQTEPPPPTQTEPPPKATSKPHKTSKTSNSTDSDAETSKKTKSSKTESSESISDKSATQKEKTSDSKNRRSKSSNSTSTKSKLQDLNKSNLTSSDSKYSKSRSSKHTKKPSIKKSNSTSASKSKSNSTSSNLNRSKKKNPLKSSNSTSVSKIRSKSSNSTTNDSSNSTNLSLDNDEIGSPTLLSYPDESNATEFTLSEKIEMLSAAKALIAVDDNNDVLHAFWMPRESPLILILPPVRTSLSKAAQRINATGRTIHYVYGEREGAEFPDEYKDLATKCMSNVETANSVECDDVFREMRFKFDTKKVLDIVNNL